METPELSPRELEVLRLAGCSNWETARRLGIHVQSVKNAWGRIYQKLLGPDYNRHRPCRTLALIRALHYGIISLEEIDIGPRRYR